MDAEAGYGREILSLCVVFLLLGLTLWKLRRRSGRLPMAWLMMAWMPGRNFLSTKFAGRPRRAEPLLETLERLTLTPQHTLHVLRLRNRQIVVATHPQGCTVLDQCQAAPEAEVASRRAGA
jgi:hypothetical protein